MSLIVKNSKAQLYSLHENINVCSFVYRCSMDPYLFENFNTVDGDFLTAKFRAFKFPESTYVQFKGTVNVCLDKCRGVSIHYTE